MLDEVFGKGYYELMEPQRVAKEVSMRNAKICCVAHILDIYKFMGRELTGNLFDKLYEMSLPELQMSEVVAEDLSYAHAKRNHLC